MAASVTTHTSGTHRPLSKYARKRAEQAKGVRPPFQFSETPSAEKPLHEHNLPARLPRDPHYAKKYPHKTRATVLQVFKNYAFLKNFDNTELHLDLSVLTAEQRAALTPGQSAVCSVRYPEGVTRPQVVAVHSLSLAGVRRA